MDFGVVYHLESAHQFWSELEDILDIPSKANLSRLDGALRNFVSFCADYHEKYLQTTLQLEHACNLLLDSELFSFHSERMSDLLIADASTDTNPHSQLILHSILLLYGRRHPAFLRSHAKWKQLIPILMDHILVDFDDETVASGANIDLGNRHSQAGLGLPIEVRLRYLAVGILYEVCRVQKMDGHDLRIFDNRFISHLFDLVEQTRDMDDEALNYSFIKLIIALNEQFMVASIPSTRPQQPHPSRPPVPEKKALNRVLQILIGRLGDSKTFGENIIFMLNRADGTSEATVLQLLLLKILYLLFTTPGTQEYFYTNDLRVLVDVFIRELSDIPEESESLRHTYLRVLHPLLTNTQLRSVSYKRLQLRQLLQSLIAHAHIRDISPTTKRLVERCMSASWCTELETDDSAQSPTGALHSGAAAALSPPSNTTVTRSQLLPQPQVKFSTIHRSVSAEVLNIMPSSTSTTDPTTSTSEPSIVVAVSGKKIMTSDWNKSMSSLASPTEPNGPGRPRHRSEASSTSIHTIPTPKHIKTGSTGSVGNNGRVPHRAQSLEESMSPVAPVPPLKTPLSPAASEQSHRSAPSTLPKRRKAPAVPVRRPKESTVRVSHDPSPSVNVSTFV